MSEINEKSVELLQNTIEGLLNKMNIEGKISTKITEDKEKEIIVLNIETNDGRLLIGPRGKNLSAFQHLARVLLARQNNNFLIPFTIDVNNYKKDKERYLKNLAKELAQRVKQTKKEIAMEPMPAHERRIVHLFLSNFDVSTESVGEEPNRRIIIKLPQQQE